MMLPHHFSSSSNSLRNRGGLTNSTHWMLAAARNRCRYHGLWDALCKIITWRDLNIIFSVLTSLICIANVVIIINLRREEDGYGSNSSNNGAFVQMGRAGGGIVSTLLRNGCDSAKEHPCRIVPDETILSKLVERYYYPNEISMISDSSHSFYVVTVREPLDRIMSSFVEQHFSNTIARGEKLSHMQGYVRMVSYKCFPSLESFTEYVGDDYDNYYYPHPPGTVATDDCSNLAKAVVHGKVRSFRDFYYNYETLQEALQPSPPSSPVPPIAAGAAATPAVEQNTLAPERQPKKIYVLRYEYLWKDWKQINKLLGQKQEVIIPTELTDQNKRPPPPLQAVMNSLSATGKQRLCRALTNEYRAYAQLLKDSENLSNDDIEQTLAHSQTNCPYFKLF